MNFSLYIAKRYLFAKTTNNAINIITIIASFGVIVGALALFIILSGFSGLRTFSNSLLESSDPDIKITATSGKTFLFTNNIEQDLADAKIFSYSKVIEERAFLAYNDKNEIAYIKGVDENYTSIINIDSALNTGNWLQKDVLNTAVIGSGISRKLSLGVLSFGEPLSILIPKAGKGFFNLNNAFKKLNVQIVGLYSGTEEFENKYVFVALSDAKTLLSLKENEITALEIRLHNNLDSDAFAEKLQSKLGVSFKVKTKQQLNAALYKVINTENFVSYLIFTLIVIIALFNVIGAIIMMIIDKKQNLKTLLNLGATIQEIKKVFVFQGFLLTLVGMSIGLLLGILLVMLQKHFGFFMITQNLSYPVEFRFSNLFIVIATISILGYIASKIASSRISKEFIDR
ncbi:FtsX-like permease family protein [uncultured Polaribacter sp.]|uniref:ABC transporter permease n=1 Tax=uncultured Polaribacter sp. TaxID=174711 RepID=UPI002632AC89|nr:FtsX-like permease family protein [uncultured Polaribacter sp.]